MAFTPQSSEKFAQFIEHRVTTARIPYRDAVLEFCETKGLEPEQVVKLLSPKIVNAIQSEAESLHLIRKEASLPL